MVRTKQTARKSTGGRDPKELEKILNEQNKKRIVEFEEEQTKNKKQKKEKEKEEEEEEKEKEDDDDDGSMFEKEHTHGFISINQNGDIEMYTFNINSIPKGKELIEYIFKQDGWSRYVLMAIFSCESNLSRNDLSGEIDLFRKDDKHLKELKGLKDLGIENYGNWDYFDMTRNQSEYDPCLINKSKNLIVSIYYIY